jgi:hypothetical protein
VVPLQSHPTRFLGHDVRATPPRRREPGRGGEGAARAPGTARGAARDRGGRRRDALDGQGRRFFNFRRGSVWGSHTTDERALPLSVRLHCEQQLFTRKPYALNLDS